MLDFEPKSRNEALLNAMAPGISSTLTIIWHPLPEG